MALFAEHTPDITRSSASRQAYITPATLLTAHLLGLLITMSMILGLVPGMISLLRLLF